MLRREIGELNKFFTSATDWRNSEQDEAIRELKANNIALKGSLDDTEKSLDHVKLSLDRGGSQVRRLSKQIRELQESVNVLQEAVDKDPELASSEVSRRTFNSTVNRNHVSEANVASRNLANYSRHDVNSINLNRQSRREHFLLILVHLCV